MVLHEAALSRITALLSANYVINPLCTKLQQIASVFEQNRHQNRHQKRVGLEESQVSGTGTNRMHENNS